MNLIEAANEFLKVLHTFAESEGYHSYADAGKICESLSIVDGQKVRHLVKLLENRGLVHAIWTMRDTSVCLTEEGIVFLESGHALMSTTEHQSSVTMHIDQSTTIHGNVDHTNLAVHAQGTSQHLSDSRKYTEVLGEIRRVVESDPSLTSEQKSDYTVDVENLERELRKNKPNKASAHTYIASLGGLASLGSLITQLLALLPALF